MDKRKFTLADMDTVLPDPLGIRHYPGETDYSAIPEFRHTAIFGGECVFGNGTVFTHWCRFGSFCKFGDNTVFGNPVVFKGRSGFGKNPSFNQYTYFGDHPNLLKGPFTMAGLVFSRLMCMSSVDGSGRPIVLLFGAEPKDDRVIAGCFIGTPDEFALRAKKENKLVYAEVIPQVFVSTRKVWKV